MERILKISLLVVIVAVLAAGCNLPTTAVSDDNAQMAQTYAAQTIEARLTENAANQGDGQPSGPDDGQAPSDPEDPTDTPEPSDTPEPTNTPKPTLTPTKEKPCNMAAWVKDVTVPDGTEFAPGETFTKTWRLENDGTCTWNNDYDLVFDSGDKMGGSNVENINMGNVAPGDVVDISVDLTAPGSAGDYKGKWKLRSDDGVVFALGEDDVAFWVDIEVVEAVSFKILGTNVYDCSGDSIVAIQVKNTGTKQLESTKSSVKNLGTNNVTNYLPWDNPFTENSNDCPVMGIDNIEPGDIYYTTFNMSSASGEYRFTVRLCTQENGGGDCAANSVKVTVP